MAESVESEKKVTSRRDVLKLLGALGAGVVVGAGGLSILTPTVSPPGTTSTVTATVTQTATPTGTGAAAPVEDFVYTACPGGGCHEECVLKTIVDKANDKIIRVEVPHLGGAEEDWPSLCAKGLLSYQMVEMSGNRVLYPMKRVGNRGEGKFERITWQQAMDEIGAKLREIRDKYGPESLLAMSSPCGSRPSTLMDNVFNRFESVFGASYFAGTAIDTSEYFAGKVDFGYVSYVSSRYDVRLLPDSNMIITIGSNPQAMRPGPMARYMLLAKDRGTKLVHMTRWYDQTAAKADQNIFVKAGSDGAFLLAMARVIIDENLVDWNYMTNYTTAPLLVRDDNGLFLRESDITAGGDKEKYVYWDAVSKSAKPIAAHVFQFPQGAPPDLLAAQKVKGIGCKTAFLKLKEHLEKDCPNAQEQEKITGVPASVCTQLARDYVNKRPCTFVSCWGYRYQNGGRVMRAVDLLAALSGNLGLPGGRIIMGHCGAMGCHDITLNTYAIAMQGPQSKTKYPLWRDIVHGTWPIKAIIMIAGNYFTCYPSKKDWIKVANNCDLIVQQELRFTDTTAWCDYVLPDKTQFEEYEIVKSSGSFNRIVLQEPAVKPRGEAKGSEEFWALLSKQVGLEQYFYNSDGSFISNEQWIDQMLKASQPDQFGPLGNAVAGMTYDQLKKEKMLRANVPTRRYDPFVEPQLVGSYLGVESHPANEFATPSGRFDMYYEKWADIGEAMANVAQPFINGGTPGHVGTPPDRTKYPLQFVSYRERFFMQSQYVDVAPLKKLASGGTGKGAIWINPALAKARGISEGDAVEAFNDRGSVRARAHLSERFPPDMVNISHGFRMADLEGGEKENLQVPHSIDDSDDNLTTKAGWMWDVFFDCYCDIRKV